MTTDRFNQDPTKPYGYCVTCREADVETTFADRAAMVLHMHTTADENKAKTGSWSGHACRATNPTRLEQIKAYLDMEANDRLDRALEEFITDVERLVTRGDVTRGEATLAVKEVWAEPDWAEAWAEYVAENYDDEDPEPESESESEPQLTQADALPGMETV